MDTGVNDFQCRNDPLSRIEDVEHSDIWAFERLAKDEGQFNFYPWDDKAVKRDVSTFLEDHVIEQCAVVGLCDVRRDLHGT
ncbi:hypothetical protein D9M71_410980 [compost metagenome]